MPTGGREGGGWQDLPDSLLMSYHLEREPAQPYPEGPKAQGTGLMGARALP